MLIQEANGPQGCKRHVTRKDREKNRERLIANPLVTTFTTTVEKVNGKITVKTSCPLANLKDTDQLFHHTFGTSSRL